MRKVELGPCRSVITDSLGLAASLPLVQPVLAFWANVLKHFFFPCRSRVFKFSPLEVQDS